MRRSWPFALLVSAACDPFHAEFAELEPAVEYTRAELGAEPEVPPVLTVMTWNVKFGGGRIDFFFDCYGDRVLMTEDEVLTHLEGVAAKIRQVDPDVLILQELDVRSKRSAYLDQAQWLLDHTNLRYGVYASQWRADYVPSDGIGPVDSGNAILSKWPLVGGERIALPLQEEQSALVRYFYLRRNILRVKLALPGQDVSVVAIHADAYGRDGTKKKHIDRFLEELDTQVAAGALVIAGGDLNALPPGTLRQKGFPDTACVEEDFVADDYSPEADWLVPLYDRYAPAIDLAEYDVNNALWFSHTTDKGAFWNRTLDHLFTSARFVAGASLVHQSAARGGIATMPLSDHAPLTGIVELP